MAQFILKFDGGGTFKTNTDEYDSTLLLRDYEAEVLSDIANHYLQLEVIGRPRKRRAIERNNNYLDLEKGLYVLAANQISDLIKSGNITRIGAATFEGLGLDNTNVHTRHALDALNRAIAKLDTLKTLHNEALKADNSKMTFLNYFSNLLYGGNWAKGADDRDLLVQWLDLDEFDSATGTRARTNRLAKMRELLEGYGTYLTPDNYNFEMSPFGTYENFQDYIKEAVAGFSDSSFDPQDAFNLTKLGMSSRVVRLLFAPNFVENEEGKAEKLLSEYQLKLKEVTEKADELIADGLLSPSDKEAFIKSKMGDYALNNEDLSEFRDKKWEEEFQAFANTNWKNPYDSPYLKMQSLKMENGDFYKITSPIWRGSTDSMDDGKNPAWGSKASNAEYAKNLWDNVCRGASINWAAGRDRLTNALIFRWLLYDLIKSGSEDLKKLDNNRYLLLDSIDLKTGTALVYNFPERTLYRLYVDKDKTPVFLEELKARYEKEHPKSPSKWKLGGTLRVLKALDGATIMELSKRMANEAWNNLEHRTAIADYGEDTEETRNRARVGHNVVDPFNNELKLAKVTTENGLIKDLGFDDSFWWTMASMAQDIASIPAAYAGPYGPAVAAGLGITSTITDAIGDFTNDAVTAGEAWSNLAANAGFAVLGAIPIANSAKWGRILNKARKVLPNVWMIYEASSALRSPELDRIYKKFKSKGVSSFTSNDWEFIGGLIKTIAFAHNSTKANLASVGGNNPVSKTARTIGNLGNKTSGNRVNTVLQGKAKRVGDHYELELADKNVVKLTKAQYETLNKVYKNAAAKAPKGDDEAAGKLATEAVNAKLKEWATSSKGLLLKNGQKYGGRTKTTKSEDVFQKITKENVLGKGTAEDPYSIKIDGKSYNLTEELYKSLLKEGSLDLLEGLELNDAFAKLKIDGTYTAGKESTSTSFNDLLVLEALAGVEHPLLHPFRDHAARTLKLSADKVSGYKESAEPVDLFDETSTDPRILENVANRAAAEKISEEWVENPGLLDRVLNPLVNLRGVRELMHENLNNAWEISANGRGILKSTRSSVGLEEPEEAVVSQKFSELKSTFPELETANAENIMSQVSNLVQNVNYDARLIAEICKKFNIKAEKGKISESDILNILRNLKSEKNSTFDSVCKNFASSIKEMKESIKKAGGGKNDSDSHGQQELQKADSKKTNMLIKQLRAEAEKSLGRKIDAKSDNFGRFIRNFDLSVESKQALDVVLNPEYMVQAALRYKFKEGGIVNPLKTLRLDFSNGNSSSSKELSKYKVGGILKAETGLEVPNPYVDWYTRGLYPQVEMLNKGAMNRNLYGNEAFSEATDHNKDYTLGTAAKKNYAYTLDTQSIRDDILHYYDQYFPTLALKALVEQYNKDAETIRNTWLSRSDYALHQKGMSKHNDIFRKLFDSRTNNADKQYYLGWSENLKDILGTTTWMRRMDRYLNFENWEDALSQLRSNPDLENTIKSRIHEITLQNGEKGYVFKQANGNIEIINPDDLKNIELTSIAPPVTPDPETGELLITTIPDPAPDAGQGVLTADADPWAVFLDKPDLKGLRNSALMKYWDKYSKYLPNPYDLAELGNSIREANMVLNNHLKKPAVVIPGIESYRWIYGDFNKMLLDLLSADAVVSGGNSDPTSEASVNRANLLEREMKAQEIVRKAMDDYQATILPTSEKSYANIREDQLINRDAEIKNITSLANKQGHDIDAVNAKISAVATSINNYLTQRGDDIENIRETEKAEKKEILEKLNAYKITSIQRQLLMQDLEYLDAWKQWKATNNLALLTIIKSCEDRAARAAQLYVLRLTYPGLVFGITSDDIAQASQIYNNLGTFRRGGKVTQKIDDTEVKKRTQELKELRKLVWNNIKANLHALDNLSRGTLIHLKKMMNA